MYEPQQPNDLDPNRATSGNSVEPHKSIIERAQEENLSVQNVVSRQNQLQSLFSKLIIFGLGLGVIVAIAVVIGLKKFGLADKPNQREAYPQQEQIQDENIDNVENLNE